MYISSDFFNELFGGNKMQEDLYTASITDEYLKKTKSYNLSSLFIAAFFGQIIAITVLGLQNAIWLKVEKKILYKLVTISSTLFVFQVYLTYLITHQIINLDEGYLTTIGRVIAIVTFVIYYNYLKSNFEVHMSLNGKTQSLLFPGIILSIIGIAIEATIFDFISSI